MAISTKISPENDGIEITLTNGHREALQKIVKDYGLISEKEAIIFLLGIISQANGTPIEINGSKFIPSDSLKTPKS